MSPVARFLHVSEEQYQADRLPGSLEVWDIPLPRRATSGSAGYDFTCPATVTLAPGASIVIPTGVRCKMEAGWVLLLFPRSGLGFKHRICLANTVGVIDSDYFAAKNEGHILVKLVNGSDHAVTLPQGDRFCQGVLLPHGLAEETAVENTRIGGFGSTSKA